MRTPKIPAFIAISMSSAALLLLAVACGGGKPDGAKDPTTEAAKGGEGPTSAGPSGADGTARGTEAPTTTTLALDAGDLQGAKLGSSSRKEIETKGDGGPRTPPGGKSDEPGRRGEDIRTMVQARRDDARACYDKALKDHPGLEGDLDVKWTITPEGNVADAAIDHQKSNIHEESVGQCIIDIIKKIKFAPSQKGYETRAHYPFNFHPRMTPGAKDGGK